MAKNTKNTNPQTVEPAGVTIGKILDAKEAREDKAATEAASQPEVKIVRRQVTESPVQDVASPVASPENADASPVTVAETSSIDAIKAQLKAMQDAKKQRDAEDKVKRQALKDAQKLEKEQEAERKRQEKELKTQLKTAKPVKTIEKTCTIVMRDYQIGFDVTAYTSDEIVAKAKSLEECFDKNADILLSGDMNDDNGHLLKYGSRYYPAHRTDGDRWLLYFENEHVQPVRATWDSAKIVISKPGEIDAWQARFNRK